MKRRNCYLFLLLTLITMSVNLSWALPKTSGSQPLQRRSDLVYGTFPNGLTYYLLHNDLPKGEAIFRLFVKSGSLNEDNDQRGLAHFLEHMAFNGSQHFPNDGMVRFLESHGARFGKDLNAHTSFDETVYKLQMPSTDAAVIDSTLLILADWAHGLSLDPTEVDKERGVILSEGLSKQNADVSTNQSLLDELFSGSRYADRPTIGDTAIIAHASAATLERYYKQWYTPRNMAIAIVGDLDVKQAEQSLLRLFSSPDNSTSEQKQYSSYRIPAFKKMEARLATAPHEKKIQFEAISRIPSDQPILFERDMHRYVLHLMTSRLTRQRLAHYSFDEDAYNDAQIGRASFVRGGDVWLSSVSLPKEGIKEGILAFLRRQRQILQYGFTEHEIAGIRKQILMQKRRSLKYPTPKSSETLMQDIYNDFMRQICCISDSAELSFLEQELPAIDSLEVITYLRSLDQPRRTHYLLHGNPVLREQIPDEKTLLQLVRKGLKAEVYPYVETWTDEESDLSRPQAVKSSHIIHTDSLPAIQAIRWQLDNGSEVIYRLNESDHDHLLLTGFRPIGLYHLDSLNYLSGLYAGAIVPISGAGAFSRDGLSDYLKGTSASMNMLIDKNRTGVSGSARTEDVELLFQLLYNKWVHPRLDMNAYHRVIDQMRKEIRTRQTTPDDLFKRQTSQALQLDDYTTRQQTLELLDQRVDSSRMLPIYDQLFGSAEGFHFILTGDQPTDSIRQCVDLWLGGLPSGPKDAVQRYQPTYCLDKDTMLLCHIDAEKAIVSLYWQAPLAEGLFDDSDSPLSLQQSQLRLDVIKGVIASHLRQKLREEMGMTYSVSMSASATLHPAPLWRITIAFSCLPQNTDTLIEATHNELQRLIADPECFASTLEDVRRNLLKQHRLDLQKSTWWTGYIRNLIYNDEDDWAFASQYDAAVEALNADRLARSMAQLFSSPCLTAIKKHY